MTTTDVAAATESTATRASRAPLVAFVLLAVSLIVGVISLSRSDENAIGAYGLISALPPVYFGCVAVVIACLFWSLHWSKQHTPVLVVGIIALVVLVHGAATLVESQARFFVAWLHAGFIESILATGHVTTSFDARFSWPGFFSGGAVLTEITGVSDPTVWLKWAPVAVVLCYVPPLLAIGRATLPGWRAPWVGAIVFVLADWVGQDYFAPQSIAYIMYLTILAILLTYFRKRDPARLSALVQGIATRLPRLLNWPKSMIESGNRELEPPQTPATRSARIGLLIVICAITVAMVSSHQLTPLILILVLVALTILGRLRPWPIFLFIGVAFVGWLSYAAEGFWSGHLDSIFGGFGQVGSSVNSGVADRVQGSPEHLHVLSDRIYFTLFVWGVAGLGLLWTWWRTRRISVPLLVVTIGPMCTIVLQSYGGEGILRVFLFSLPGACMLIAGLVSSTTARPRATILIAAAVAVMLTFPGFLIAKWGNEDFERVSTGDVELYAHLFQVAPVGSTIVNIGLGGPGGFRDINNWLYKDLTITWPLPPVSTLTADIGTNPLGTYIVIDRPQIASGIANSGFPATWGATLATDLVASGGYQIIYRNSAGVILQQVAVPAPPVTPKQPVAPPTKKAAAASLQSDYRGITS
ncbi:MAG: hypothetical protein WCP28_16400 [Actinomycetes bacterium]